MFKKSDAKSAASKSDAKVAAIVAPPLWHKDAKWIFGLLLFLILGPTLLTAVFFQVTTEKTAVNIMSTAMALTFSRNGLDDKIELDQAKLRLGAGGSFAPIPGLKLTVTRQDFEGTPREARLRFFAKLAQPFYKDGEQGLLNLATTQQMKNAIAGNVGAAALFTAATHNFIRNLLAFFIAACLISLFFLILFSHGAGRLVSPAIVFVFASLPGAFLTLIARNAAPSAAVTAQNVDMGDMAAHMLSNLAPIVSPILTNVYLGTLFAGAGLIALAIPLKVWYSVKVK